jgi:HrpA-like RNA helicase
MQEEVNHIILYMVLLLALVQQVPARQFPVTVHFSKRTEMNDYLEACFSKVPAIMIHSHFRNACNCCSYHSTF